MNVNDLAKTLGDACYGFLTLNFFWGLYCVIMAFRRLWQLSFSSRHEAGRVSRRADVEAAGPPIQRRCRNVPG